MMNDFTKEELKKLKNDENCDRYMIGHIFDKKEKQDGQESRYA